MLGNQIRRISLFTGVGLAALLTQGCGDDKPSVVADGGVDGGGGVATLSISPATFAYPAPVLVGASAEAVVFTVTNTSATNASGTLTAGVTGPNATDFTSSTTCMGSLAPGQNCTISLVFSPQAAGEKSVTVGAFGRDGTEAAGAAVTGVAVLPAALTITPPTPDFGSVQTGQQSMPLTLTVTNTGGGASGAVAAVLGGAMVGDFIIDSNACAAALAPAETCLVVVRFAPTSVGTKVGTVTASSVPGGSAVANLTGRGIRPSAISIAPTPVVFPETLIGGESIEQTLTVTNSGDAAATGLAPSVAGAHRNDFVIARTDCAMNLAAGASCEVNIAFKPTAAGDRSASLNISTTGLGLVSAGLSGKGLAPALLSFKTGSLNFGPVEVNKQGAPVAINLQNMGDVPTGAVAITRTGANANDFTIDSDGCAGKTLAKLEECVIQVRFAPAATGARAGGLSATGTPGGTATTSFSGTGLAPGSLSPDPASLNFPGIVIGNESMALTVTLTNGAGQAATSALVTTLGGDFPGDFILPSATNACAGKSLAGGENCQMAVIFKPTASGARSARLNIGGGPVALSIPLAGEGLSPAMVALTPAGQNFGSVARGQVSAWANFTLTNSGQAPSAAITATLGGTNTSDFTVSSMCPAGGLAGPGTCVVQVRFSPVLQESGEGTKTAKLVVSVGGTMLEADLTGIAVSPSGLTITPTPETFEAVVVDEASGPDNMVKDATFTVRNDAIPNTGALTVVLSDTTNYSIVTDGCVGKELVPEQSCDILVRFGPKSPGAKPANLTVTSVSMNTAEATITGNAVDRLQVREGEGAFSTAVTLDWPQDYLAKIMNGTRRIIEVKCNAISCGTLALSNIGPDWVRDDSSINEGPAVSDPCPNAPTALTKDQICRIGIRFFPQNSGLNKTATLTVTGSTANTQVAATLNGGAIKPLKIERISPQIDPTFPDATIGDFKEAQYRVTYGASGITLPATSPLNVLLGGAHANQFAVASSSCAGAVLNNEDTCLITVRFIPTSTTPAVKAGEVLVSGAVTGEDALATFTGTAVTPANLTLSGDSNFGSVMTGAATGVTRSFTLKNNGTQVAAFNGNATAVPADAGYTVTANGCVSGQLGNGGECSVTVVFLPGARTVLGARVATLTVGGQSIGLNGIATSPASVSNAVIASGVADFGVLPAGEQRTETFTITNSSGEALASQLSVYLDPATDPQFTLLSVTNCSPTPLGAGANCSAQVRFAPGSDVGAANEQFTGKLVISGVNVLVEISLQGARKGEAKFDIVNTPAPLALGNAWPNTEAATRTITVKNNGGADSTPVQLGNLTNFVVKGGTCVNLASLARNAECTILVAFRPTGLAAAPETLTVDPTGFPALGTSISVEGNAVPNNEMLAVPASVDLGVVPAGNTGTTASITVNNPTASGAVTLTASNSRFGITAGTCTTLTAANNCAFQVAFSPEAGDVGGTVVSGEVTISAGGQSTKLIVWGRVHKPATLGITSTVGGGTSAVSNGATIDFGNVVVGTPRSATLTVTNSGNVVSGAFGTPTKGGPNETQFTVTDVNCFGATVGPDGGNCTFTVTFNPTEQAVKTATLSIPAVSPGLTALSVTLTGNGQQQASLSLTPDSAACGASVPVTGEHATGCAFTLKNADGAVPTGTVSISVSENFSQTSNCPSTLQGGVSCTITVKTKPTLVSSNLEGTLTVSANPGATPALTRPVTGSSVSQLSFSAATAFTATTGTSSAPQTIALTNNAGALATGLVTVELLPNAGNDFSMVSDACSGTTLAPGGACDVVVVFTRTAAGVRTASLKATIQGGISEAVRPLTSN